MNRKRIKMLVCALAGSCLVPAVQAQSSPLQTVETPRIARTDAAAKTADQAGGAEGQPAAAQQATAPADTANSGRQEKQSTPNQGAEGNPAPQKRESGATQEGASKDRLFWTLPNFMTVEGSGKVAPLTAGQKFKMVARGVFDPVEFAWVGVIAGIGQANDSDPSYGQGAEGYGKRYATTFGDTVIENFMVGAALPALLRQDPRYFQLGKGSFLHRSGYALSRLFVTRSDSGQKQFNYSELFGSALAAGISTYSYHPESERHLGDVGSVWGTQLASDALATMLKEFWPDIRRKFHRKARP